MALNQNAFSEVNFRCFEAMACGAALLMERCGNGLQDLFIPDETILPPYPKDNAAEAARIAADYLAKPHQLAAIAENGHRLVTQHHSGMARAQTLLGICLELCKALIHHSRLSQIEHRRIFVRTAFGMIASELTTQRWEIYREFYTRLALG